MIDKSIILLIILLYLGFLFYIAFWAEKNKRSKVVNSPYAYALSLAVYCSAWTYYGSVGVAALNGVDFLTIYLGPVIASPLWIYLLRKIIRLSKVYNVSSIADFISLRYGNNRSVGAWVTIICVLSIIPYIALQLKAISESFKLITTSSDNAIMGEYLLTDTTFYIALLLAIFAAFYGTLRYDASQQKRGLFFAVSVESVIKLVIFLIVGIYVSFYLFDSPASIVRTMQKNSNYKELTTLNGLEAGINWYFTLALSFVAIFLLPRQFQAGVVEYQNKAQLHNAIWLFPLYLLLFNIFVIFIAYAGILSLGRNVNADYFSILLPLENGHSLLSVLVFLGGFSAVISMVVVSTLALSTMLSNNLIIPYGFISIFQKNQHDRNQQLIKNIRRLSIFGLIAVAYLLYAYVDPQTSLFSIGLVSFLLIAQLAPSFFIGLFWNRGSALGAKVGMIAGAVVVVFNYLLPFFDQNIYPIDPSDQDWQISALINFGFLDPVNGTFFWSILINSFGFALFSLIRKGNYRERNYGEVFANSTNAIPMKEDAFVWKGEANVNDILNIWEKFIGKQRAKKALRVFTKRYELQDEKLVADARFINFSEKLLTGAVGSASAKILIGNVVKEKPVTLVEVLKILEENKEALANNKQLTQQSRELIQLTAQLKDANAELKQQDKQKDDFLNAVAHELKTPITSIQASSEVLQDDEDMPDEMKEQFLKNIIFDTQRIANLINDILDLEKLASGRRKLELTDQDLRPAIDKVVNSFKALADKKEVSISISSDYDKVMTQFDHDKMLQVFTNLLSNALKFSPEKEGEIRIAIRSVSEKWQVTFSDNGKGVPKEDQPYIFDKFYQSAGQSLKKEEGSGFGLAICRQIIKLHQGDIRLDDQYEQGARFIVELPKYKLNGKDTTRG